MPEREAMPRYKLVPVEPTREMQKVRELPAIAYRAMLQASPEPTPEMVDDLCRKMWPDAWHWSKAASDAEAEGYHAGHRDKHRANDHTRMLAFLKRIGEQP